MNDRRSLNNTVRWGLVAASLALLFGSFAAAAPALIDGIIGGGPSGQARTSDGVSIWLDQIRLGTPRDLQKNKTYSFDTVPAVPSLDAVEELSFDLLARELIGSNPAAMETYRLGNTRIAVPPPPDWKRSFGQIPPWSRAIPAAQVNHLPFINGAVFCWANGQQAPAGTANVYLLRQSFTVQQHEKLARATLRLATNGEPLEICINEHPVQLPARAGFGMATWEVTPLIQPGLNLIAIRIGERPRSTEASYGLAFHIELQRRPKDEAPPAVKPTEGLLTSKTGDRIWGVVRELTAEGITLESAYGSYRIAWQNCASLIFPYRWRVEQSPEAAKRARAAATPRPEEDAIVYGLPLSAAPQPLQDCLLLTGNRRTTARPSAAREGKLFFEGGEGKPFSIPVGEVLGVYPPQPLDFDYQRPMPQSALLYCRLQTTRGERISGLLRQLRGSSVVLETEAGTFLELRTRWLSSIDFPYHGASAPRPGNSANIGLIPLATGSEAYRVAYQGDVHKVQSAILTIGAEPRPLGMDDLARPDVLSPARLPAVVYIDPVGEYLHTLNTRGDAQQALLQYVTGGGRLIVLARGAAFRTTVRGENGQMRRAPADMTRPNLAQEFGVKFARPASSAAGGVEPFNHPPNDGRTIFFQRASQVPRDLLGLARQVQLRSMLSAPFYPMVATEPGAVPLYDLRDDSGRVFGPAMQIIPRGRGAIIVIDHLLWESEIDNTPFVERELPKLLRSALSPAG
ncbi:MAG: hypothetical protein ABFD69_15095 [Candidatus Sumerlaeia bacterium]